MMIIFLSKVLSPELVVQNIKICKGDTSHEKRK